jgi:hypothetical protein
MTTTNTAAVENESVNTTETAAAQTAPRTKFALRLSAAALSRAKLSLAVLGGVILLLCVGSFAVSGGSSAGIDAHAAAVQAWSADAQAAGAALQSRVANIENKTYVRLDGVVTTSPKAGWLFQRKTLGQKINP